MILIHSVFPTTKRGQYYFYLHFSLNETGTERLSGLPKATQVVSSRATFYTDRQSALESACTLHHYAIISCSGYFCTIQFLLDSFLSWVWLKEKQKEHSSWECYRRVVLKLQPVSESPGSLLKTQIAHPQFWFSKSWVGLENLYL